MDSTRPTRRSHPVPGKIRPEELDGLDEQILWELYCDADITNVALAEKLHVSASTTLARVKSLRQRGLLRHAHADVDLAGLGLPLHALISVRLRPQARPAITSYARTVSELPNVLEIFFLAGQTDFLIHVVTTSPEQLRDLVASRLSTDPAVASTETHLVFDWHRDTDDPEARTTEPLGLSGFEAMRVPMPDRPHASRT